jgi:alkylation response protein AidB-like acyl-CoA dehydrogenase
MMSVNLPRLTTSPTFLTFTDDEIEVQKAAASFLGEALPLDRLHSPGSSDLDPAVRREIGALGWFSLSVPEAQGGSGLSAVEHVLYFRECGRECGPIDLLAQSLAVRTAVGRSELRSLLSSGEAGVMVAVRDGDSCRLLGDLAARYAISVEPDGSALFDMANLSVNRRPALDPGTSMGVIAALPANPVVELPGPEVWQMAQLGTAAMLVGVAERALSLIVDYAKVRETFGRKIGSYQAVRHPCADMELRAEAARSQLWYAAAALKLDRRDSAAHVDAAKHMANEAAHANADTNIQLHGGIGITDEHHAHLLLKRSLLLSRIYGSKRTILSRLLHAELED